MVAPVSWSPKDPDETLSFELDWSEQGLASGDTITLSEWQDVSGVTVVAQSVGASATSAFVTLTGGADGQVAYLLNVVDTANGEHLEQPVLLPIVANVAPAALVGYAKPTPGHLVARYPAFAAVAYSTVQTYLTDAEQGVDTSWSQPDYAPALMALAAHNMMLLGIGSHGEAATYAQAGLTRIKTGNFEAGFSDKAVGRASGGGYDATVYGQAFKVMLRRNKGGPRIIGNRPLSESEAYPC